MQSAAWITAIGTAILALSVPVAWFSWLSTRKHDRERQQRERDENARAQALKDASGKFVSKDTATGVAVLGAIAATLIIVARFDIKPKP